SKRYKFEQHDIEQAVWIKTIQKSVTWIKDCLSKSMMSIYTSIYELDDKQIYTDGELEETKKQEEKRSRLVGMLS
ncbi:hypothetical protein BD560DRAFT_418358, partial [Blakeslea trispora]